MLEDRGRRIRPPRQGGRQGGGDARLRRPGRSNCRSSTAGSKPAASRSPRRSTACAWAAASSWRWPATIASSPTADKARVGLPEIKVGLFPGGGRHAARRAADADARRAADAAQGRSDPPGRGQEDGPRARGRAGRSDRRARQGLGEGQSERQGAMGRPEVQASVGQGLFGPGHDDLAAGQRHLSPRDL